MTTKEYTPRDGSKTAQKCRQREVKEKISQKIAIQGGAEKKKVKIDGNKSRKRISEVSTDKNITKKKKRRMGSFISESEFKRLAQQQPIPWSSLSHDIIYKLEWVNKADKQRQIAGNLTDSDGITVSVLLSL